MTSLRDMDESDLRELLSSVGNDPVELEALIVRLESELPWTPQEYQLPPAGDWWAWVFSAGAGTGKTDTGAWWLDQHMTGPACDHRVPGGHKALIAGPTFSDALTTCWQPPAGISAHNDGVRVIGRRDGTHAIWPNGAEALFAGLHSDNDVALLRARAANCCTFWIDEAAQTKHLATAIDLIQQRVRAGARPHGIVTSTPRPSPGWKYLISLPKVVVTHASSFQNRFLSAVHKENLERFIGTRLEAQEIHGELVDDYAGALFDRQTLDDDAEKDKAILRLAPEERLAALGIVRTFTGVDPSTWIPEIGAPETDDYVGGEGIETGLVTIGVDRRNPMHVYVLDDRSGRVAAIEWGKRAASQHHTWHSVVVPETNAGGDQVLAVIALTDDAVPIYREVDPQTLKPAKKAGVRASIGKRARAEPVGQLSDQHRLHLVGDFPALVNTMCGWDPSENWSPDRLDALVWAVTAAKPWKKRPSSGAGGRGSAVR